MVQVFTPHLKGAQAPIKLKCVDRQESRVEVGEQTELNRAAA